MRDLYDLTQTSTAIPCPDPYCGAAAGEPCRTLGGKRGEKKTPHACRVPKPPCPGCGVAAGLACEDSCTVAKRE